MDTNNNIKRKLNQYFKEKHQMEDYRNGWLKGHCPYCGKHKFGINIGGSKANCFSCGNKYSPFKVVMELEGISTKVELFNFLKAFEGSDFLQPEIIKREWVNVKLPESFKLLSLGDNLMGKLARKYISKRGFDVDELSLKGIGYCTSGDYMGCIILPFYQQGELVYFIGRRYISLGEGKFKNPSVDELGIGKSLLTYNADALAIYKKIYAVESITNCLTIGDNSIATLGKTPSEYQISMIIRSPITEVILGYDPDALKESIKLGLKLIDYKKVKLLILPNNKDINDIGKKATKKIEKDSEWLDHKSLLKLKHQYE